VAVDVRLVVVAVLVILTVALGVTFARAARAIREDHRARFSDIQRRLETDAAALLDLLLRRH
jgi:hypothetical protein